MRKLIPLPLLLVVLLVVSGRIAASDKPNFLFILVDDLGFSDLGCYGGEIETPHLDSLAENGLRYTQFYNTGRCWPTRVSLLSGYYPQTVHRDIVPGHGGGGGETRNFRQDWARLIPDFIKPAGYRNYHSGKWHIDGPVLAAGFDKSRLVRNQGDFFSNAGNRLDDVPYPEDWAPDDYYCTTATADHAIECLVEHSEQHADKPFFHYLAFIAPHFPLHARPEDIAKYESRYLEGWEKLRAERYAKQQSMDLVPNASLSPMERDQGPPYDFPDAFEKLGPGEVRYPVDWDSLTDEQKQFQAMKMAIHAAMIDCMDREIGRVIDQLKKMGEFDNTVIFFASDNGASAEIMVRHGGHDRSVPLGSAKSYLCLGPGFSAAGNTPFRKHKTWVHEGGTATPLIVHWPDGIEAKGALRRTVGHTIDIAPTVLELAGVEMPTEWKGQSRPATPGKSLVATFEKDTDLDRDYLWWFHDGHRAVRVDDWKLVSVEKGEWELYDLSSDRSETNDLSGERPDKVKELSDLWQKHLDETIAIVSLTPENVAPPKRGKGKGKGKKKGK